MLCGCWRGRRWGLFGGRLGAPALRETTGDHPFLREVYDDADRDDLTVELSFLIVHANPFRRIDRSRLAICDFSPAKDMLFAEEMLDASDLDLFRTVYDRVYGFRVAFRNPGREQLGGRDGDCRLGWWAGAMSRPWVP
jgi:deoxyadenosine/deoxycytidine kinase